jgi:hypothetical protein
MFCNFSIDANILAESSSWILAGAWRVARGAWREAQRHGPMSTGLNCGVGSGSCIRASAVGVGGMSLTNAAMIFEMFRSTTSTGIANAWSSLLQVSTASTRVAMACPLLPLFVAGWWCEADHPLAPSRATRDRSFGFGHAWLIGGLRRDAMPAQFLGEGFSLPMQIRCPRIEPLAVRGLGPRADVQRWVLCCRRCPRRNSVREAASDQ